MSAFTMIGRCLRTKKFSQSLPYFEQVLEFRVEQVDETREIAVNVAPTGEPIVLAGMSERSRITIPRK